MRRGVQHPSTGQRRLKARSLVRSNTKRIQCYCSSCYDMLQCHRQDPGQTKLEVLVFYLVHYFIDC